MSNGRGSEFVQADRFFCAGLDPNEGLEKENGRNTMNILDNPDRSQAGQEFPLFATKRA